MVKASTLNQEKIREINRVKIISILRSKGETTKQEIAAILKLSIPTVTTNINLLVEEGFVTLAGVAKSTGGRKPVILKFVENAKYAFGVDITVNQVKIILLNLNYHKISELSYMYEKGQSFEKTLETIESHVEAILLSLNIDKTKVVGIGFSLPGLVDEDHLRLDHAPNLGVKDYDFRWFEKKIGIKVSIENEANVAAFAESLIGVAKDKHNLVYISITEGVGTGIIINNHIYKSTHKRAGEFGHMRVSAEDRRCNCGRTGCWELYASKNALIRYYGVEGATVETVFLELSKGNEKAISAVGQYLEQLYVGIENIILGLNPEFVIIGGELGKYEEYMTKLMEGEKGLDSSFIEYEGTKILFSSLGDNGALMGAALLPLEDILNYRRHII